MKIKEILKMVLLVVTIIFLGCGNEKKEQKIGIIEKTKEALGSSDEEGCSLEKNNSNQECSQNSSSSSFILNTLIKESKEKNQTQNQDNSLRRELNSFVEDVYEDRKQKLKLSIKDELENLVESTKDREDIRSELEELVDSTKDREDIRNELEELVNSTENREDIKSELDKLVNSVEKSNVEKSKLLQLVEDVNKQTSSIENTKNSLESLVSSAQNSGTASAKRLASSIIRDVSQNKIKILKTEDKFIEIEVQQGDSLSSLAYKYYGNSSKYNLIYEMNKDKINDKKVIYPGTILTIPKI